MGRPITKVSPFYRRRLLGEAAKAGQALDLQIQTDLVIPGFHLEIQWVGLGIAKGIPSYTLRVYISIGYGGFII